MTLLSKSLGEALYPDLIAAGRLCEAVTQALKSVGSHLTATTATLPNFIPYARVEQGSRFSQIYVAAEVRLFTFDFWFEGIAYGNGATPDISKVAAAVHTWIVEKPEIASMKERFDFFAPTERGVAHEAGSVVEYQWRLLLKIWGDDNPAAHSPYSPRPLIEAAMLRPELRRLYPFTSLYDFCLSRTTGYPYTDDCPHATPLGDGLYRVHSAKYEVVTKHSEGKEYRVAEYEVLGEGTVEAALDLLVANLPPGCGPAANGTAGDSSNG